MKNIFKYWSSLVGWAKKASMLKTGLVKAKPTVILQALTDEFGSK
jgi:hypothetical protein